MLHRPLYRRKAGYSFIRSLNPAAWFRADTGVTVTGLGASTWADQSGNGRDLLQSTDASRPPYLSYTGTKYLYLPGVSGNYASTPDSVANSITGDIDIRVKVALADWTPSATQGLLSKDATGTERSYSLYQITTGSALQFFYTSDGSTTAGRVATSSAAPTASDGDTLWIRVTYASATGKVNFYQSSDGSSWSAIGTEQTITSGAIYDGTAAVSVGAATAAGGSAATGKFYRASIYSTIGGTTPVVDFNPDLDGSDQAATITSSATGEVWTINSSGGLPAQIVGRPSLLFDGSADYLKCNAFTLNRPYCLYVAMKQVSWTTTDRFLDGNTSAAFVVQQLTASPNIRLADTGTGVADNTNLAVGSYGVVFASQSGTTGTLQVNNTTPTTGTMSGNEMGGFTLGAGATPSNYGNIQVLEVIIAAAAHDAPTRARVIQYLAGRHGIAL